MIPERVESVWISCGEYRTRQVVQVSKLVVSVSCGELWWPEVVARDDGSRGKKVRCEGRFT